MDVPKNLTIADYPHQIRLETSDGEVHWLRYSEKHGITAYLREWEILAYEDYTLTVGGEHVEEGFLQYCRQLGIHFCEHEGDLHPGCIFCRTIATVPLI